MWAEVEEYPHAATSHRFPRSLFGMERSHDFDVCAGGWVADYRDPKNFLFLFQTSSTDLNYGLFSDAGYDAMVEQSDHVRDVPARGWGD